VGVSKSINDLAEEARAQSLFAKDEEEVEKI